MFIAKLLVVQDDDYPNSISQGRKLGLGHLLSVALEALEEQGRGDLAEDGLELSVFDFIGYVGEMEGCAWRRHVFYVLALGALIPMLFGS